MSVVYASSLGVVAKLSDAMGLPIEALLQKVDIDIGLLNMPDAPLPGEKLIRLYQEIQLQTGNNDFGLLCGRINYMESFHLYMSLASASNTFRDWINLIPSISPGMGGMLKVSVRRKGDYLVQELHVDKPPDLSRCMVTDNFLACTVMLMDGFCVLPVRPLRVDLTYEQPGDTTALRDVFRAPLHFGQPVSALYYHSSILDYPQLHVSTSLYDNAREELDEFFSHQPQGGDPFTINLYTVIRRQIPSGDCTVGSVAKALNMSSRTLQLRLQERGTQFRSFVQQVKSTLALKYLEDKNLRVIDIALLLGYKDSTAFTTAFTSWHGSSPRAYRGRR